MTAPPPLPCPARLALTRETACLRALAWRTDLPVRIDWAALAAALEARGLARRAPVGALQRFAAATGDEILVLPASGRIQLRVHYTVPAHQRRFAAERLFRIVVDALRRP